MKLVSQLFGNEWYAYFNQDQVNTQNAFAAIPTTQESVNMRHLAIK